MEKTHRLMHAARMLVQHLDSAHLQARLIEKEYIANGNDSLANIDYGASLNAHLHLANQFFQELDDSGIFTMGND